MPVAALSGANLVSKEGVDQALLKWYIGPTLVELLGLFVGNLSVNMLNLPYEMHIQTVLSRLRGLLSPHCGSP